MADKAERPEILKMAIEIVVDYVGQISVATEKVPDVVATVYAAIYEGMQGLMDYLAENCCQNEVEGCSSDCPEPLPTRKKQKRTRQKVRAA